MKNGKFDKSPVKEICVQVLEPSWISTIEDCCENS